MSVEASPLPLPPSFALLLALPKTARRSVAVALVAIALVGLAGLTHLPHGRWDCLEPPHIDNPDMPSLPPVDADIAKPVTPDAAELNTCPVKYSTGDFKFR